jgi:hypothetical protein
MRENIEKRLLNEAESCDNCLCWLDHCKAECCYHFNFRLSPLSDVVFLQDEVRIRIRITSDLSKYLDLHGVKLDNDVVVIPKDKCNISPRQIQVTMRCLALQENLLCQLHPDGKPDYCKALTW